MIVIRDEKQYTHGLYFLMILGLFAYGAVWLLLPYLLNEQLGERFSQYLFYALFLGWLVAGSVYIRFVNRVFRLKCSKCDTIMKSEWILVECLSCGYKPDLKFPRN